LYLVINGQQLARLHPEAAQAKGHLPVEPLEIEKIGDVVSGDVVFEVPAQGVESLELRFYDFAHGSLRLPLVGATNEPVAAQAVLPLQKNAILEAGVFGYRKDAGFREPGLALPKPPPGMTFAVVELRARSLQILEAASGMFDPHAAADAITKVGTVCDWPEGKRYVQLIADGEYAYAPCFMDSEEPRFLPDLMTLCRMVFLVPENNQSLELRMDFPATDAENEAAAHPAPILFALEGARPKVVAKPAIVAARDGVFRLAVTGQSTRREFSGRKVEPGTRLLVLDATVENTGKGGEWFQAREQLKFLATSGDEIVIDDSTVRDQPPVGDNVWVPGGERRSFQAVFRIDENERAGRLRFTTTDAQKDLKLQPIAKPE
jgi:hypothetical protein